MSLESYSRQFFSQYASRLVNYNSGSFIRLATDVIFDEAVSAVTKYLERIIGNIINKLFTDWSLHKTGVIGKLQKHHFLVT